MLYPALVLASAPVVTGASAPLGVTSTVQQEEADGQTATPAAIWRFLPRASLAGTALTEPP